MKLGALVTAGLVPAGDAAAAAGRYAYFLFLADPPQGCEDCYEPEGTVPIHRVQPIPDKKSLEDLVAAFRGQR